VAQCRLRDVRRFNLYRSKTAVAVESEKITEARIVISNGFLVRIAVSAATPATVWIPNFFRARLELNSTIVMRDVRPCDRLFP